MAKRKNARSLAAKRRSAASKKGWATRRRKALAAEKRKLFLKRSRAAKKGWTTRRRNEKKFRGGTVQVKATKFSEYLVTLDYSAAKKGAVVVDIVVIGPSGMKQAEAIVFTLKHLKKNDQWLRQFSKNSFSAILVEPSDQNEINVEVIAIKRGKK